MFACFVHVVGKLIFGPENFDHRDPRLQEIFCSTPEMDGMFRIGCLTDCFAWMKLLRRKTIADIRRVNEKFDDFVIQKVDNRIERRSTDIACLVDALRCVAQKEQPTTESDVNFTCYAAMDAFGAGLFTSIANAKWALLLLAKYPNIQKRLRSEIMEYVGCRQFVSMEHRASLNYAEAFMNEVLRFATVLPLAIPHASVSETLLLNYHCPKSTPVLANLWAAHRDPTVFSNPDEFNPDRFLDNNGCLDRKLLSRVIPFSTGARRCPGEPLARQNLFLIITNLVKYFEIQFAHETDSYDDLTQCVFNFTRSPRPFELRFRSLS
ncbi:p450 domain containing protein [Trichuris trichiura]|uniref:p450 domain containing protein n=1 Tax=Trichuris trichiura TaxID=36087 RepID=A0A077Z3T1_TRITR|nr:p450 domain containing protein [Trichuris trichiura]